MNKKYTVELELTEMVLIQTLVEIFLERNRDGASVVGAFMDETARALINKVYKFRDEEREKHENGKA